MTDHRISVLCVDDSADIASLYAAMVSAEPDMQCAGTLHSADDLVAAVAQHQPDIVLLDLTMPGRDPLDALREIAVQAAATRVIVFSGYDGEDVVERAIAAGAWMLVSKHDDPIAVLAAIRAVARAQQRPVRSEADAFQRSVG